MFVQLLILGEMGVSKEKAFPIHSGQMAVSLLQEYRITHVAKELGLNARQLRKKQLAFKEQKQSKVEVQEKTPFIELNQFLPNASASSQMDTTSFEIQIERKDGARLILSLTSSQSEMVQNLVTAFIRS